METLNKAEPETVSAVEEETIDYKSLYEKTREDLEKVAAKKDELYKETKKAKSERESAQAEAQRIAEEKAQKDGEFEKLWKTAKQEKDELLQKLQHIEKSSRNEKIQIAAMRVATELADGDNAELLSEFVMRNLDKMSDERGSLSDDVLQAVRDEFKNNSKFKSLLRSSKATGGSAPGNLQTNNKQQTLTRAEFEAMPHASRGKFLSGGGKLVDNQ